MNTPCAQIPRPDAAQNVPWPEAGGGASVTSRSQASTSRAWLITLSLDASLSPGSRRGPPWRRRRGRARVSGCRSAATEIPVPSPAPLVHQALTLDHISNGRLELGLGVGLMMDPRRHLWGFCNWSARERVAGSRSTWRSSHRRLSNEVSSDRSVSTRWRTEPTSPLRAQKPRPPITIAASSLSCCRCRPGTADTWNWIDFARDFQAQLDETPRRCPDRRRGGPQPDGSGDVAVAPTTRSTPGRGPEAG